MKWNELVNGAKRLAKATLEKAKGIMGQAREWLQPVRKVVDQVVGVIDRALSWVPAPVLRVVAASGLGELLLGGSTAHAQTSSTPDASTIVTTAQTTFDAVGALVAAAVGFFIIVKIVKWIRK
jgi:phosphopantothenoylcysteine synthetase/decarboxylase